MSRGGRRFAIVVGHPPEALGEGGAGAILKQLGADVVVRDFFEDPEPEPEGSVASVVVVQAGARPDIGGRALRHLRKLGTFAEVPALLVIKHEQVSRFDPAAGFDDFVLSPIVPAELYARVRALEWHAAEFDNDEILKVGDIVIDKASREVTLRGTLVTLTQREFELLCHLADKRGKLASRDELLARVWGDGYEGGPRTVDVHVRRLRAKLGHALPLETLRGVGYKLARTEDPGSEKPAKAAR
jgi:DNA-binding response OmpR family regulator